MPQPFNRYNFASPAEDVYDALTKLLAQRKLEEQQAFLNKLKEQEAARQDAEMQLRREQEDRINRDSQRNFDALQYQREDNNIARQVDDDIPGDAIDAATAGLRRKHGFGGTIRTIPGVVASRAITGVANAGNAAPTLADLQETQNAARPDQTVARGGARYLQAQAAAEARAELAQQQQDARDEQARLAREAAADRAREANQTRELIAGMNNAAAGQRAQLAADDRTQRAQERKDAANDTQRAKSNSIINSANDTLGVVDELIDEKGNLRPGVPGIVGATLGMRWFPGSKEADKDAALKRLQSLLDLDVIQQMKAQSRTGATGFGALSEKELAVLERSAGKLGTYQSEGAFAEELKRIRKSLQNIKQDAQSKLPQDTNAGFKVTEIK